MHKRTFGPCLTAINRILINHHVTPRNELSVTLSAAGDGGGILSQDGLLAVGGCMLNGNSAVDSGAGIALMISCFSEVRCSFCNPRA
jgi:hypothetical protein